MKKMMSTQDFINAAKNVHGDRYSYVKTEYNGQKNKVIITCRTHGDFKQYPAKHTSRGDGCQQCAKLQRWQTRGKLDYKSFVDRSIKIHKNKYEYPIQTIDGNKSIVEILCNKHGTFRQVAYSHLDGAGCPKCSSCFKKDTNSFINIANEIHKNRYTYEKFQYVNCKVKGKITCSIHGDFEQTPDLHINARAGCPHCGSGGAYSEWYFENNPEMKKTNGVIYIVEMSNNDEVFLKIGITEKNANKRFASPSKNGGYKTRIILQRDMNMYDAWKLEQKILSEFKDNKYIPLRYFPGHTECLNKTNEAMVIRGML